jgi:hypothetical protein
MSTDRLPELTDAMNSARPNDVFLVFPKPFALRVCESSE